MLILSQNNSFVKWHDKKIENMRVSKKMIDAGFKERGIRMKFCGQYLEMKYCEDCGKSMISSANLCRDRLCPTCSWRLSLKRFAEMCNCIGFINDLECFDAGFLTLTVRNCKPENLRYTLDTMSKAWNRMRSDRKFRKIVLGTARSVEVTYNEQTKTFHPHFHVIILYKPCDETIMRMLLSHLWERACQLDYKPITDFRIITDKDGPGVNQDNDNLCRAILETFKYSVKSDDVHDMPIGIFRQLVFGISGVRMVSYTGIIKEARKKLEYKTDELTEEDENINLNTCSCGKELQRAVLQWSFTDCQYRLIEKFGI